MTPQEWRLTSVLAPFLFNIFISDLLNTVSRKYACAADLAIMFADGDPKVVDVVLSKGYDTTRKIIERHFLESTVYRTTVQRRTIYRTTAFEQQFIEGQSIERQFVEFDKTKYGRL